MSYKAKPGKSFTVYGNLPEIDKAINTFNDEWLKLHDSDEDLILYHYTTNGGLKGILQSHSIWFSHIKYFNDPQEWHYGKEIVLTQLKKAKLGETEKDIIKILKNIEDFILTFEKILFNIFVACFCKNDNLLSQWREYADDGGGYSLGISFDNDTKYSHYKDLLKESYPMLRKVIYNPEDQNEIVEKFLRKIINAAQKEIRLNTQNGRKLSTAGSQIAMEATNTLSEIIPCLKDSAFEKENEWRLIQIIRWDKKLDLLNFRESKGELIPYIPTYFYKNDNDILEFPIKSMRYGPMLDSERADSSLRLLMNSCATSSGKISFPKTIDILGTSFKIRK